MDKYIKTFARDYAQAFVDADIDKIISLFTEDFVALTPDKPPISGHQQLREVLKTDLTGMDVKKVEFKLHEAEITARWAYAWGISYCEVLPQGADQASIIHGKFMWILIKQDNHWLLKRDCSLGDI